MLAYIPYMDSMSMAKDTMFFGTFLVIPSSGRKGARAPAIRTRALTGVNGLHISNVESLDIYKISRVELPEISNKPSNLPTELTLTELSFKGLHT